MDDQSKTERRPIENGSVILGLMAPSIKDQFPEMDESEAYNFTQDNLTLHRLRLRGILTDSERNKAVNRLIQKIKRELKCVPKKK